jgi:hypothetical protein
MVRGLKLNLVSNGEMTNEHIVVVVQLEYLQGTHGGPKKNGPPLPNHNRGMLARYNDVLTIRLFKKVTAKEWKAIHQDF